MGWISALAFYKLGLYNTTWQTKLQESKQKISLCFYLFQFPKYKPNCPRIQQLADFQQGQILSSSQETDAFWHVRDTLSSEGVELLQSDHCTHNTLYHGLLTVK